MKITKSQLKQIIKEELDESEWIDVHGDEPLPPHSMGRGTEAEQTPNLFVQLELLVQDLVDAGEDPEEIRSHVEGVLENIPAPETSEEPTPEYVQPYIDFYQENPSAWSSVARNQYYKMATGEWGPKNDPEGVWANHYSDWKRQDFIKVITKIDGSYRP